MQIVNESRGEGDRLADGPQVTAQAEEPAGHRHIPEQAEVHPTPDEREFAAGVHRSSSPRPGALCCNRPEATRMEAPSDSLYTDDTVYVMDTSSDSSVLLEFICFPNPRADRSDDFEAGGNNEGRLECMSPITINSSHDSSHFSSVSQHLPPVNHACLSPSPPLAQVSLSEVLSTASTERVDHNVDSEAQGSLDRRARELVHSLMLERGRLAVGQQPIGRERMAAILTVARWLLRECTSRPGSLAPVLGGPDNPIILD